MEKNADQSSWDYLYVELQSRDKVKSPLNKRVVVSIWFKTYPVALSENTLPFGI